MNSQILFALFNGMVLGSAVFMVAAGLTLVFGILKIFNFAHGSFFMVGAYLAHAILGQQPQSLPWFLLAGVAASLGVGILGIATDLVVFRRLAGVPTEYTLIATFAVMLICNGGVRLIFGQDVHTVYPPPLLDGIAGIGVPASYYSIFIIVAGFVLFGGLELVLNRLWFGKIIQAVASDAWMSDVLGLKISRIQLISVGLSFALAGLAGGLLIANQSLSLDLGHSYLLMAFNCVIVGGLGSIPGAYVAALLFGLFESLNAVLLPSAPGIVSYILLIALILIKPDGLFARRER